MNTLLLTAFLRTIARLDRFAPTIALQVPTGGRVYPHRDAETMVGDFAQNLSLSFDRPAVEGDRSELLARVHQAVREGITRGHDRERYRQLASHIRHQIPLQRGQVPESSLAIFRAALKSNLYCPYTGQTRIRPRYGPIEILEYRSGGINAAGTLDLLQEIFDDRLHLFLSYDGAFFDEPLMENLLNEYRLQIETLATSGLSRLAGDGPSVSNPEIEAFLLEIAATVTRRTLSIADLDRDLEAELGLDSLDLIRLIARISARSNADTDRESEREQLLSCRRLREMVAVLTPEQADLDESLPYRAIIEQTRRTPEAIAILDGDREITYRQLHLQSNRLANYLRSLGVQPGDRIGIVTGRNARLWIGILGILKAGGAYVPIDPTYPGDRVRYMLEQAEIGILLSEVELETALRDYLQAETPVQTLVLLTGEAGIDLDRPYRQVTPIEWGRFAADDLPVYNRSTDLMTVLFTSGSTGRPKGVTLNHRGYMNRLMWMQKAFPLAAGDRVAHKTSCCFDISVWEIFWPLMVGAAVCPVDRAIVKNPWRFAKWLNDTRITVQHFVPSLFGEFINALEGETVEFPHLRWLIFSGEALPVPFIQRWVDRHGWRIGLANLYGPTEASIDVTAHIIEPASLARAESGVSIGRAIDNVSVIVLDEHQQPVPTGELGELCIGGIQLATGYLHEPEKTAAAIIRNPFPNIDSSHLYRTGDLVRMLADGSIEYRGRIDHQVKIRGFRIELGEIENVLNAHEAVREAAAIVLEYEPGQKQLVAVYTGREIDPLALKQYLSGHLPDYMIPHRLEWAPDLPKNHNGKLDRKALQQRLQSPVPPIEEIKTDENRTTLATEQTLSFEYLPLGPAQKWLVRYFDPPYQWTGYTRCLFHQPLDGECFNRALNYVVQRHFALKTVFVQREGQWWQKPVENPEPIGALFYDGSALDAEQRDEQIRNLTRELARELRIDRWPLIRVLVVKVNDTCYDINIIGHHIIGDLLSNRVVSSEFWQVYALILAGKPECLSELPSHPSYADYVRMLLEEEEKGDLESHLEYWRSRFPSPRSAFSVPYDLQSGANLETSAESQWFILDRAESQNLLKRAKQYYGCNLYPLLLAPLYRLMAEWGERDEVVISHRCHSRDLGGNRQFFNSVGNFATNFPIGLKVAGERDWKQTIADLRTKLEELPMNGGTFDWLGDRLPSYVYPDNYLSPVRANYLGNRDLPASPLFEFIKEDWDRRLCPPEQKRTTLLEFFLSIAEGRLELQIEYSRNFHLPETIERLGERYLSLLRELLAAIPPIAPEPAPRPTVAPSSGPLAGKVAVLLGSQLEIDSAIASRLAREGATVTALFPEADYCRKAEQVRDEAERFEAIAVDWNDPDAVRAAIDRIGARWGGIDLLINHPGLPTLPEPSSTDPRRWRDLMENLLWLPYRSVRYVLPHFHQRGRGKILTLSAASAWETPSVASAAYTMACEGLANFTRSLATEVNPREVQVNGLCLHNISPDRIGSLEPLLETVCFLLSPLGDRITGQHWQISPPRLADRPSAIGENLPISSLPN
jgi:amino acid adenylation domain-containing protein